MERLALWGGWNLDLFKEKELLHDLETISDFEVSAPRLATYLIVGL